MSGTLSKSSQSHRAEKGGSDCSVEKVEYGYKIMMLCVMVLRTISRHCDQ